jgi:hypothetical protein
MPSFSVLPGVKVLLFLDLSSGAGLSIVNSLRGNVEQLKDQALMSNVRSFGIALAAFLAASNVQAQFATSVVSFNQGDTTDLVAGYTNSSAALGAPTTYIGYQNSDPFNPPYANTDIVGLGAGGSLTVQFSTPILNSPGNPYGISFMIFGHAGFQITNGNYSGGGITDGTFFQGGVATTRVSVSADGVHFYTLDPTRAPNADGLFPIDSNGNFLVPVNPALTAADFAGKDLNGIRALYNGSGGGTGYDLAWAQDSGGNSVALSSVDYVRVDVLSGYAYLDAFSVVPEPSVCALAGLGSWWFVFARLRRNRTGTSKI